MPKLRTDPAQITPSPEEGFQRSAYYASTKHELLHLFPRLAKGGVLIIDDYGHWQGARQAVDEYFAESDIKILLNRVDYTGRIGVRSA